MNIDKLRVIVSDDIEATKEYGQYLEDVLSPELSMESFQRYAKLKFFNEGYKYAMEKIKEVLKEVPENYIP